RWPGAWHRTSFRLAQTLSATVSAGEDDGPLDQRSGIQCHSSRGRSSPHRPGLAARIGEVPTDSAEISDLQVSREFLGYNSDSQLNFAGSGWNLITDVRAQIVAC